jgi:THO complex subunit 4
MPRQKVRQKKGPRRIKKSLEQLDKEMDDYRAAANSFDFSNGTLD